MGPGPPSLRSVARDDREDRPITFQVVAAGWPIVGDNIYGSAPRQGGPPLHLHAREVVVPISKNKPPVKVTAPVPAHMRELLSACGWTGEVSKAAP